MRIKQIKREFGIIRELGMEKESFFCLICLILTK